MDVCPNCRSSRFHQIDNSAIFTCLDCQTKFALINLKRIHEHLTRTFVETLGEIGAIKEDGKEKLVQRLLKF